MHLKRALEDKISMDLPPGTTVIEDRQPGIPFLFDVRRRLERTPVEPQKKGMELLVNKIKEAWTGERQPTKFREHAEYEAIPHVGAYAGLAGLGATGGAGLGALVAGKGYRAAGLQ